LSCPMEHLCIIPHGPLCYIPFHALKIDDRFLQENYSISYAPSVSAFLHLRRKPKSARRRVIVFANPERNLPAAEEEATRIQSIWKDVEIYDDARKSAIIKRLKQLDYDIVHFAGHGQFDGENPLSSALLLAEHDFLTVYDIMDRDFSQTSLVVLSACQTGLHRESREEEFHGLAQAFLHAGARSVIASLWAAHERPTALFMEKFYNNLLERKMPVGKALRQAQQYIMLDFLHPYYWASFILFGDWN